jgi:hypothetical protein
VVDKVVLGQDSLNILVFSAKSHSTKCSIFINDPIIQNQIVSILTVSLDNEPKYILMSKMSHYVTLYNIFLECVYTKLT